MKEWNKASVHLLNHDTDELIGAFDTVAEAQRYAEIDTTIRSFGIYTLYSHGSRESINWNLQTSTADNLREIKKVKKAPRSSSTWTALEIETLKQNYGLRGMSIPDIAKALNRTYNAVYSKLVQQKLVTPRSIRKKKK